jgi:2',3'-cyclic-nucleotide 2'-phosphodiesterase (5'-nucleotidase family)
MLDMRTILVTLIATSLVACAPTRELPDQVVISVIGTNDVHGELMPRADHGGIAVFSGYVANIREARSNDGDLLLVDAGDMWQGTLESNLNEGLSVVEAYNAMGYSAAAIGNHEFDFGPVGPRPIPRNEADNPRGALQAGASKAEFPLLAANLVDSSTGEVVEWDNVQSATLVEKAGVVIGIVGVLTEATPSTTIAANVRGLEIAPLAETIEKHATRLRQHGASLVIVVAHAGSRCAVFDDPSDTSSCDMDREIMRVAQALPAGLVDHIVAGHEHQGIAHVVNGIAVTAAYSNGRAFSRVDFTVDRATETVVGRRIYPPQPIREGAMYEGRPVAPSRAVAAIVDRAARAAAEVKSQRLGAIVETALLHRDRPESPLGNLFTDAVLQMTDADIAIHNVWGGIRAEMPEGEVTYGDVYRMMPFDNRIAIIELSGADLRRVIARQAHNRDRAAGFSGMRVFVSCEERGMVLRMLRDDGTEIEDNDRVRVVANDFLLLGGDGILTPVMPDEGFDISYSSPLLRDTLADWFRQQQTALDNRRWNLPDEIPESCQLNGT